MNNKKLNVIFLILIVSVFLNGCSSESYLECDSTSNEKIIYNIIKKNQKIDFTLELLNVYSKKIDKITGNRSCHSSLNINVLNKIFKAEIDYDVVKLLKSKSTHQVNITNYYQSVETVFYNDIKPYIKLVDFAKLAKSKGFNSANEYQNHLKNIEILKRINLKIPEIIKKLKTAKAQKKIFLNDNKNDTFKNKKYYLAQGKIINILEVKIEDNMIKLKIENIGKLPIIINSDKFAIDIIVYSDKFQMLNKKLLKVAKKKLNEYIYSNEVKWLTFKNTMNIEPLKNNLLFSIRYITYKKKSGQHSKENLGKHLYAIDLITRWWKKSFYNYSLPLSKMESKISTLEDNLKKYKNEKNLLNAQLHVKQ